MQTRPALGLALAVPAASLLTAAILCALPTPAGAERGRSDLDLKQLAECISDSGAVFYGAHWCPYCHEQKRYFGEHADLLPYLECYGDRRAQGQNDACDDAGVRSYPTWVFADGSVGTGAIDPARLASATGCE